jgi:hypothetical protein
VYLERVQIVQYGPFTEVEVPLVDSAGAPRALVVVHGEGGTGKTSLIEAISHTRPGKVTPPPMHQRRAPGESFVVCDWRLGVEDPDRPHALRVISPNVRVVEDDELSRRREQSLHDRCAAEGPGYVFVEIPSQRYFSRSSLNLSDPARSMTRYDARGVTALFDAGRPDLTRPCKQALAYAAISAALAGSRQGRARQARALGQAMDAAVSEIVALAGHEYRGLDPHSLEPMFESGSGQVLEFDALPTQVRHLIAFVALPLRAFWAAFLGQDPRTVEGVIAIDDYDLYLPPRVCAGLLPVLRRALPRAQWIVTTGSPYAAGAAGAEHLITLRREGSSASISVYEGDLALTH